ncbi:fused MFS/spermidine synthase [Paenibacillus sp. Marseille-Q4541]|uniref:spermidine synthase n=1 Tax=Paenibacillus sp. Marseille-Q4541 TaxID=2831522 RepID=UPI001BA56C0A|nr:fused MFS/spermidine synthase [Paenibacillus sp. Marseille-Q4541]
MVRYLHQEQDPREIYVYDTSEVYGEKGNFRVLEFGNDAIQGILDLNEPSRILFEYPRAILHLMEVNNSAYEDVFLIGHGVGTLSSALSDKQIVISEIDQQVSELSTQYFNYKGTPIIIEDGYTLLQKMTNDRFDYVVVDAFHEGGIPKELTSRSFFETARDKLDSEGKILMNIIGRGPHDPYVHHIYRSLASVFPIIDLFYLDTGNTGRSQNMILVGGYRTLRYQQKGLAQFRKVTSGLPIVEAD